MVQQPYCLTENSGDVSGSGTTLIMSLNDNMYNERVDQVIFTQDESGKTISVTCKQGKKETSGDIGIIKLWSGPGVPENYVLCNGGQVSIAEVDYNDSDYSSIGNTGGEKGHQLTVNEMPSHTHSYTKIHIESYKWGDNANSRPFPFYDSGAQTESTGGNQPHENRPPYYVLAYVMKVR